MSDYDKCKDICWFENYDKHTKGYYIYGTQNNNRFSLHQFLFGKKNGFVIDHKNHDTTDNRRENLRMVTLSENAMNQRIKSNNTSGVKGVRWHKATQKWQAGICVNQKHIYLGVYQDIEDAAQARKQTEEKYFGDHNLKTN